MVAQWLAHLPLVLDVPGSISAGCEEYIGVSEHALPSVICRSDTRQVCRPSDLDVNWMSPVQGKSPLVQVKEPYCDLDRVTCRLSFCSVKSTPADNACEGVRQ